MSNRFFYIFIFTIFLVLPSVSFASVVTSPSTDNLDVNIDYSIPNVHIAQCVGLDGNCTNMPSLANFPYTVVNIQFYQPDFTAYIPDIYCGSYHFILDRLYTYIGYINYPGVYYNSKEFYVCTGALTVGGMTDGGYYLISWVQGSLTPTGNLTDVSFGIAVIIGILFIFVTAFMYNQMKAKKPWL